MTVYVDADTAIINRALQVIGTRTTVTTAEMNALSSNEAIQADLIYSKYRNQLLRMAPWDCALRTANLLYITSTPGTPENMSPATPLWQPGQPSPPWGYEYFYPSDCLRACFVIPASQTGFASGVPITTAVTGGSPLTWAWQPVKFKVQVDSFRQASASALVAGGTGYQVNEIVTLGGIGANPTQLPAGFVQIMVLTVNGTGAILTYSLYATPWVLKTGFFFAVPTYTLTQSATTGFGTGATLTVSAVELASFAQRVILTNQEFATLAYCREITDPNAMDELFQEAWVDVIGAGLQSALRDDIGYGNSLIARANGMIERARSIDANEGFTQNDVTPDWIRVRGVIGSGGYSNPWGSFDWGSNWPSL